MDIWQVLMIGIRRWMVTIPVAVVGVIFAWTYSSGVQPVYSAEASLLYLPPAVTITALDDPSVDLTAETAVEVVDVNNPFAGSLRSASLAVELYMSSDNVRGTMADFGLSSNYSASTDRRNAVLYLFAEADSPDIATQTIDELLNIARDDLRARQDAFNVDPREQVTAQVVTQDEFAAADYGGRVRIRAILLMLALIFAFGGGVLVEGVLDLRAGRRPFAPPSGGEFPQSGALTIQIPESFVTEMGPQRLTPLPRPATVARDEVDDISAQGGDPYSTSTNGRSSRWSRAAADGA